MKTGISQITPPYIMLGMWQEFSITPPYTPYAWHIALRTGLSVS